MAKRDLYTAPRNPQQVAGQDDVPSAQETIKGLEKWYETNKNPINYSLIALAILIGGIYAYTHFLKGPKEVKASEAVFRAEQYFAMDSLNFALNGDGNSYGFLKIIEKYNGTKTGNLAHYYAGIIYLKQGQFQKAIDQLEDFDANGTMVEAVANGSTGDAYMELGKTEKAISYYEKASADKDNELLSPLYLERQGLAYEKLGKTEEAIAAFKKIKLEFSQSAQARNVDKYLARLGDYSL